MKLKLTTILAVLIIFILSNLAISYYAEDRIKNGIEAKLMRLKPVMSEGRCHIVYLNGNEDF